MNNTVLKYELPILEQTIPEEELILLKAIAQKQLNQHKFSYSVSDFLSEYSNTSYYTKDFINLITHKIKVLHSYPSSLQEATYFSGLKLQEKKDLLLEKQKELFTLEHLMLLIKTTTNWMKPDFVSPLEGI